MKHIPAEKVVNLYHKPKSVLNGHIYDKNIVGRYIELIEPNQQRHCKYLVTAFEKQRVNYKPEQWKLDGRAEYHTLQRANGTTLNVELNKLHAEGKVRHPPSLRSALSRLDEREFTKGPGPQSREVDAERYGRSTK